MSLDSILYIQNKKKERRKKIFKDIYEKVKIRINHYTQYSHTSCQYDIPALMYGVPNLQHSEIADYLEDKLKTEGFGVWRLNSASIYISWEEAVTKEQKKRNKIKKLLKDKQKELEKEEDDKNYDLLKTIQNNSWNS